MATSDQVAVSSDGPAVTRRPVAHHSTSRPFDAAEIVRAVGIRLTELRQSVQREFEQAEELRNAQLRAKLAEIDASELRRDSRVAEQLTARLAELKDGIDGKDGRDGIDGAPGINGRDGRDGTDGAPGQDGAAGRDGIDGAPGRDGERGERGPQGEFPIVAPWSDRVHYAGEIVTHDGHTWQATRDTGRAPPDDWHCLARGGNDGRSFTVRGTFDAAENYRALDVVALNGASFVARRDDPGGCPGDGWQMIAAQGKRGQTGERGAAGRMGERGFNAPVVTMDINEEGLLTLTNADGSTVTADFYPLLARLKRP